MRSTIKAKSNSFLSAEVLLLAFLFVLAVSLTAVYLREWAFLAYLIPLLFVPFLLVAIPIEPFVGIIIMFVATSVDIIGVIAEASGKINYRLTYFQIALAITFISLFLNMILKKDVSIPSVNIWFPLITFYCMCAISLIYTPDYGEGALLFARLVVMGVVVFIILQTITRKWKVQAMFWLMIMGPVIMTGLTFYQVFNEGAFFTTNITSMATSLGLAVFRATGTFGNPNDLGIFMMLGILIPYGLLFNEGQSKFTVLLLIVAMCLSSAGIIVSFSRASWLATLTGIIVITTLHRKWSFYFYFAIIFIVALIVLSVYKPEIVEAVFGRFLSIFNPAEDASSSSRISMVKSAIWMWQDHPTFGVGLSGYAYYYYEYVDTLMPDMLVWIRTPHTVQAQILAELGLVGFTIATWFIVTILWKGMSTIFRMKDRELINAQIIATALVITYIVDFTFAADMVNNIFWMVVGLIYAIPLLDQDSAEEAETPTASPVGAPADGSHPLIVPQ